MFRVMATLPLFRPRRKQIEPFALPFYGMWDAVAAFAAEIRNSAFMIDMMQRREARGGQGLMGALDCATLYALTRWHRPSVVVETGGFVGLSAAFILKAMSDAKVAAPELYSIESSADCDLGALVPDDLRANYIPVRAKVEEIIATNRLPGKIDMFLHESSHRYRHMKWEFRRFWARLRDGGLLVAHDVHMNAAFPEFVIDTLKHDKATGALDAARTTHHEWGRWGYIGFMIKKGETKT